MLLIGVYKIIKVTQIAKLNQSHQTVWPLKLYYDHDNVH